MIKDVTIYGIILQIWSILPTIRKKQIKFLLTLMITTSIVEVLSVGSVMPFLGVLINPEVVMEKKIFQNFNFNSENISNENILIIVTLIFSSSIVIAGLLRISLVWASSKLSYTIGSELSEGVFRNALYQNYEIHIKKNSSETISGITNKTAITINALNLILTLINSSITLIAILLILIILEPTVTLISFSVISIIYSLVIIKTKNKLNKNSEIIALESSRVIKNLQEGLGGIRDVLLDGTQEEFCLNYKKSDEKLRKAQIYNYVISHSPKYIMETVGILLISILAYNLASEKNNVNNAIPILGLLAMGAQRMLPLIQQVYVSVTGIQASKTSLKDVINLLNYEIPENLKIQNKNKIKFEKEIKFNNIYYRYDNKIPWVLEDINLTIQKGDRVGIIGETGSGKSTLIDLLMGLLLSKEGHIKIDNNIISDHNVRDWQNRITHVPQSIFLTDGTIKENIAFGINKNQIDFNRVEWASEQAQISEFINLLTNKYETKVGERGVMLSGGQRQRIGIARALYKKVDVIIMDEATSALDEKTEQEVIRQIEKLDDITIIMISHRLTTLNGCNKIINIINKKAYVEIKQKIVE